MLLVLPSSFPRVNKWHCAVVSRAGLCCKGFDIVIVVVVIGLMFWAVNIYVYVWSN